MAIVLLGILWASGTTAIMEGRLDAQYVLLVALVGGNAVWPWLRRHRISMEMILEPDRLRVRDLTAGTPFVQLDRLRAGPLGAAETGLDWRRRRLVLADDQKRVVAQFVAGDADLVVRDATYASEAWWGAHMPAGTSPGRPPSKASVTASLGAWWPRPDQRFTLRGSAGVRKPWKEAELPRYDVWDFRQRRLYALVVIGMALSFYAVAFAGTWPPTPAELVAFLPPGLAAMVLAIRRAQE